SSAVSRSSSDPAPVSMIATPAVACGTNTCSSPSPRPDTNPAARSVMSTTAGRPPVRTSISVVSIDAPLSADDRLVAVPGDELAGGDRHPRRGKAGRDLAQVVVDHLADGRERLGERAGAVRGQHHPAERAGRVVQRYRLLRPDVDGGPQPAA